MFLIYILFWFVSCWLYNSLKATFASNFLVAPNDHVPHLQYGGSFAEKVYLLEWVAKWIQKERFFKKELGIQKL